MKHKVLNKNGVILAVLSFGLVAILPAVTNKITPVKAAIVEPKQISLPTTLHLKHNSEQEVRDYYKSLNNLSPNELKGKNLLKNLKPILKNGSTYVNYDTVWQTSCITDRDWTRSPAESIPCQSYDPKTMTVTEYKDAWNYKDQGGDDPYYFVLYRNDNGKHNIKNSSYHNPLEGIGGINKEHVWPKSRGFSGDKVTGPAGTDVHHLMIADAIVNQASHGNLPYGNVVTPSLNKPNEPKWKVFGSYENTPETYVVGNYRGTNEDGYQEVFEPIDAHKGDIARAIFYMVARYNNFANEANAITTFEPFLDLSNNKMSLSVEESTDDRPVTLSYLKYLYQWHIQDPVDDYEIYRNDLIYNNFQNNRNPFIDYPEWIGMIWTELGENTSSQEYAKPATDHVSLYGQNVDPNPDQGGGEITPPDPVDPDPVPDENTETNFKGKTTIQGASKTPIKGNEMKAGNYFITVENANDKVYLDSNNMILSNGKITANTPFNTNLTSGYFNFAKNSTNDGYLISNHDQTQYLAYSTSTNLAIVDKANLDAKAQWKIVVDTQDPSVIYPTNLNDNARCLLYQISNTRFGGYKNSNIANNDYLGIKLHETIYTYDVLLNKLKVMTCENMKTQSFLNALQNLYTKLSLDEQKALESESIVCNDGKTYTAMDAYLYAMSFSINNQNNLLNFDSVKINTLIIGLSILTVSAITLIVLFAKKKSIKSK